MKELLILWYMGRKITSPKVNPLTGASFSQEYYELQAKLADLPANQPEVIRQLHSALDQNEIVIIKAETGAGKSVSIVPQIAKYYNFKKRIICTQPRSLNTEVAKFVAKILDDPDGKYINYAYRHQVHVTSDTVLSYETDGRVVNYFYKDPNFNFGDILIIDEVHEKNPYIEFMLLFMKKYFYRQRHSKSKTRSKTKSKTRSKTKSKTHSKSKSRSETVKSPKNNIKYRNGKKLVIMSATIDLDYYLEYFKGIKTSVIEIPGRTHPVESVFLEKPLNLEEDEFLTKAQEIITQIINRLQLPGDILVFVPAISQIEQSCRDIHQTLQAKLDERVVCLTLYRGISEDKKALVQDAKKFRNLPGKPTRKIVFSTNIAESGVTIDGIKFVIDSGLAMNMTYDSATRMKILKKEYISKFEIEQRKGRAGRTAPGTCFHLYTEEQFEKFHRSKPSEMQTMNLDFLIMDLLRTDLINTTGQVEDFFQDLIEPPSQAQLTSTFRYLKELRVIKDNRLTERGRCLHHMNISEVGLGIAILAADYYNVVKPVIQVAAMLEVESNISKWFRRPFPHEEKKFRKLVRSYRGSFSDLQMFLKLYREYKQIKDQTAWAKRKFVNLSLFHKARRTERDLWNKYRQIPSGCKFTSSVTPAKDLNKNMVLAFLHGYYNQVLVEGRDNEYENWQGIKVNLQPGRYNSLTVIKPTVVYMELISVLGRIQANGLINVTGDIDTLMQVVLEN